MKAFLSKTKRLLLLGLPLVIAMIGFVADAGEPFFQSLFLSLCMYFLNYQELPPNLWIEIARWTAPLATASGFLLAAAALRNRLRNHILYRKGNSTAVYGSGTEKAALLSQLGSKGIDGKTGFVRAHRYILVGPEEENLAFYQQHREKMSDSIVYLKCCSLPAQTGADPRIRPFCPEETAARLFWKEHCLYRKSVECGHIMRIVFIGFGKLGEELLVSALQNNLFSPNQKIEYHIFSGETEFFPLHKGLSSMTDPIVLHREPWYDCLHLIDDAQVVIVLKQTDQLSLLRNLLLATHSPLIHVFAANPVGIDILSEQERLVLFDWQQQAQKLENILSDQMYERAKRINLRYAHLYANVPENAESLEAEWAKLDSFTRYSNISAADYHEVQRRILDILGCSTDISILPDDMLEELSELEHIRWCRYHYLNNWTYGIPEGGRVKDKNRRIHSALIPYASLSEEEKEKDRENLRILFSMK